MLLGERYPTEQILPRLFFFKRGSFSVKVIDLCFNSLAYTQKVSATLTLHCQPASAIM